MLALTVAEMDEVAGGITMYGSIWGLFSKIADIITIGTALGAWQLDANGNPPADWMEIAGFSQP